MAQNGLCNMIANVFTVILLNLFDIVILPLTL